MWAVVLNVLGIVWKWAAPLLGLATRAAGNISWKKVLIATFVASMIVAFGSVILSFSREMSSLFDLVFPDAGTGGTINAGTGCKLGVMSWFGMSRLIWLASKLGVLFVKLSYVFALDWCLWAASQCLLLWLIREAIYRILVYAGSVVRAAWEAC